MNSVRAKSITVYRVAQIAAGCFFAEAGFLVTQIVLMIIFLNRHYPLAALLAADHVFYALPPHFEVVGSVFLGAVLYGEWRRIRFVLYYVGCGLLAAVSFHAAVWLLDGKVMQASSVIINLLAAVVSGLVYWFLSPRHTLVCPPFPAV